MLCENSMTARDENPSREELEKKLQSVHGKHLKIEQLIAAEKESGVASQSGNTNIRGLSLQILMYRHMPVSPN
jgi:hypothetical protein